MEIIPQQAPDDFHHAGIHGDFEKGLVEAEGCAHHVGLADFRKHRPPAPEAALLLEQQNQTRLARF